MPSLLRCLAAAAIAATVLPASYQPALATTRNVPADFATIQAALNASIAGDVVLVAPGTYLENLVLTAAQNGVRLLSVGGPDVTTIDGGRLSHVVTFSGAGPLTSIEGFTITRGGETPLATLVGGGVLIINCSPTIKGNVIRGNEAVAAGGIYVDGGAPLITNNRILDNQALGGSGGGIYFDHFGAGRFEGNVVASNFCAAFGGGVTAWENSAPELVNNTIVLNQASLSGGGVYAIRSAHLACSENIVAFNPIGGGVVVQDAASSKLLNCCDTYGNGPANYVGLPDPTGSAGNISTDPLFCDLSSADYGLTNLSPCAAANAPAGCGQIGALGVTCSPTPVARSTWGQLKVRYRGEQRSTDTR